MKVLIVANLQKPQVKPAVDKLVPWLQERATLVAVDGDRTMNLAEIEMDLIVVLGGDGTFLSTAGRLAGKQTPVIGFNFGRLGFLASFAPDQLFQAIEQALEGRLEVSKRLMMETSVIAGDEKIDLMDPEMVRAKSKFTDLSLNDVVISAGAPFRMIELQISTNRDEGMHYFGDGMIICTSSGSTAYNISAGGPILNPEVEAMCITPLCPHSLSFRPIVVGCRNVIIMHCKRVNRGTTLVVDGQSNCNLNKGDRVLVRRAPNDLLLLDNPQTAKWQALGEKLHWASVPKYNWK